MSDLLISLTIVLARGLALLVFAFAIHACLRRRSATVQNHLWRSVVIGLLMVPLLAWMPPLWELPIAARSETPTLQLAVSEVSEASRASIVVTENAPLEVVEEELEPSTPPLVILLITLWMIGCLLLLVRFGFGYWRLARLKRQCLALPPISPWLAEMPVDSAQILAGDAVPVPLVFGILRPCMLLPSDVVQVAAEDRQMILRHEMAHVRRRDGVFQLLHCLALALHWPNPLAWLAIRRLRLSEERAVDDLLLTKGHCPIDYAELLSRFASGAFLSNSSATPHHAMAQASTVRTRVSCVLNANQARQAPSTWLKSALNGLLTVSLILLGSLQAQTNTVPEQSAAVDDATVVEADVYAVDRELWQKALRENAVKTAEDLLSKVGIALPTGSGAVYDRELSRVVVRAPGEDGARVQAYFAKTFQAYPRSAFQVELTFRVAESDDATLFGPWPGDDKPNANTNAAQGVPSLAGVFTKPQLEVILHSWKNMPSINLLAAPNVVATSGHPASIQVGASGENLDCFLQPTVTQDGFQVDLDVSFDPPEVKRKVTTNVVFDDESTVLFRTEIKPNKSRAVLISARVIRPKDSAVKVAPAKELLQAESVALPTKRPDTSTIETVVLDPGHGGHDAGGRAGNLKESELTLAFSQQLRRELEDRGYNVILTRQKDRFIPLKTRATVARDEKKAVFVSVHFNASGNTEIRGVETYYPRPEGGEHLQEACALFARTVQGTMAESIGERTRSRGIRAARWTVLMEAQVPAVLIEAAFLSNAEDLALVQRGDYLDKLATGIANGVIAFDEQRGR